MDRLRQALQLVLLGAILFHSFDLNKKVSSLRKENMEISLKDSLLKEELKLLQKKVDTLMTIHPWHKPGSKK